MTDRSEHLGNLPIAGACIAVVVASASASCVAFGSDNASPWASTIFVAPDVAIVHLLCAVPAALILTVMAPADRTILQTLVGVGCMSAGLLLLPNQFRVLPTSMLGPINELIRMLDALLLDLGIGLIAVGLVGLRTRRPCMNESMRIAFSLCVGVLTAGLVPIIHLQARCRHDLRHLDELLSESRVGEARQQAYELLRLQPDCQWRGRPLRTIAQRIDRQVDELEHPLVVSGDRDTDRLNESRRLAMLGRTMEAMLELQPLLDRRTDEANGVASIVPAAHDLCGTIYETSNDWRHALQHHRRAKELWIHMPPSPERSAGILRSSTRLGRCERKLGSYTQAEADYRDVLTQSPTAENHFLLARFYEDIQQSAKARLHARQAIALDPRRYQAEGTRLIDKLMINNFGCMGISSAEFATRRSTTP